MGLDESVMKGLLTAALLHDIGKLAIPEHIINKPGKLTREEFEKMKIHTVVGADILARVKFPYPVVPIVRSHHEAWDGSGYPDGLKGEEIPIGARILTVVDCFDALASDRPYRRALPLDEAMAFVKSRAGIQFDPAIVDLLDRHYQRLEELARQRIEDVEPLKTDLFIKRGAAPGAGFEPERDVSRSGKAAREHGALALRARCESLKLIAGGSLEDPALFDLSELLGGSLIASETSSLFAGRLQALIPFDCCAVYVRSGEYLLTQYMEGPCARAFSIQPIPVGQGLSGWVARSERPIVNGNPTVEPNYLWESGVFANDASALSMPLFGTDGTVFGVLTVYARKQAAFSKEHLRILQTIQSSFFVAFEGLAV
jgi:putative nucleotidyltransferase with HDIG domain